MATDGTGGVVKRAWEDARVSQRSPTLLCARRGRGSMRRSVRRALFLISLPVTVAACGGPASADLESRISTFEGYSVTNCRPDSGADELAREVRDLGASAYMCSSGLGVLIQADGQMSTYDASSDETAPAKALTAGDIAAQLAAQLRLKNGSRVKRVECGSSTDVTSGAVLSCAITLPTGTTRTFRAVVTGSNHHYHVALG